MIRTRDLLIRSQTLYPAELHAHIMGGEGFEPSKAELTDLQSAPFGHSGIHPNYIIEPMNGLEPLTC